MRKLNKFARITSRRGARYRPNSRRNIATTCSKLRNTGRVPLAGPSLSLGALLHARFTDRPFFRREKMLECGFGDGYSAIQHRRSSRWARKGLLSEYAPSSRELGQAMLQLIVSIPGFNDARRLARSYNANHLRVSWGQVHGASNFGYTSDIPLH